MRRVKGKAAALLSAAAAMGVIVFAAWRWGLEAWWIHQLDSTDTVLRRAAVRSLGEARSRWAVPRLMDRLESAFLSATGSLPVTGPLDRAQIFAMATATIPQPGEQLCVLEALCRIGPPAYEALEARPDLMARVIPIVDQVSDADGRVDLLLLGLRHPSRTTLLLATEKLGNIGIPASRAIPALLRIPRKNVATAHVVLRALRQAGWDG